MVAEGIEEHASDAIARQRRSFLLVLYVYRADQNFVVLHVYALCTFETLALGQ